MLCYTLSFVDRQILSLLVGPIKHDLHISDTQMGLLLGFAFAIFYTFAGLPIGRIVDTYGRRNPIAVGIFLWSIMTAVCSLARSYWTLFLARIGVGVGEATLSPAAFSLISDYFPAEKLGLAISVYTMGIFFGSGVALAVGGTIVDSVMHMPALHVPILGTIATWRLSFLLVGIPGILVGLLVYTVREPLRKNVLRDSTGAMAHVGVIDMLRQIRQRWQSFWGMAIGMVFQSLASYAFLSWAPTFFQRIHGWTAGQAGRALGILVLSLRLPGNVRRRAFVRPLAAERRGFEGPLKVAMLSATGAGIFLGIAMLMHDPYVSLALMAPGTIFSGDADRDGLRRRAADFPEPDSRPGVGALHVHSESGRHRAGAAAPRLAQRSFFQERAHGGPVGFDFDRVRIDLHDGRFCRSRTATTGAITLRSIRKALRRSHGPWLKPPHRSVFSRA